MTQLTVEMTSTQLNQERARLQRLISETENTCGSCRHWMNPQCPREKVKKVSGGEWKCQRFEMSVLSMEQLERLNTDLKALDDVVVVNDFESFFKGLTF